MTDLFKVNWRDVLNSCLSAAGVAVIGYLSNLTSITTIDPKQLVNVAVIAFVVSLSKKLVTDSEGKVFGKI